MALIVLVVMAVILLIMMTRQGEPDVSTNLSMFAPVPTAHVQVVVARYAEDLSWLSKLPFDDIIVYDKYDKDGPNDHGNPPPNARVVSLPNVGRCDHTYLYHIIANWDALADVTIFVPGSCATYPSKWAKLSWVVAHVTRTGDSAFPVDTVSRRPVYEDLADFKLDKYQATSGANSAVNPEDELRLSDHRPFSEFYRYNFPDLPPVHAVAYKAVFAVSRTHIRQNPKSQYSRLLAQLDDHSNPEAGHYMERSWLAAFHPIPRHCTSLHQDWEDVGPSVWWLALWCCATSVAVIVAAVTVARVRR